ncbi:MAG TPA: hypothetical protein VHB01_07430 [Nitrosospira sp.]|nr:hypothetical protein [Nitrosospira sp.]
MKTPSILQGKAFQLSISALLLTVCGTVFGEARLETRDKAVTPPMEFYDIDKDGYVSAEEAAAQGMSRQVFQSLDINHDGRLNKDEFSKMPPLGVEKR